MLPCLLFPEWVYCIFIAETLCVAITKPAVDMMWKTWEQSAITGSSPIFSTQLTLTYLNKLGKTFPFTLMSEKSTTMKFDIYFFEIHYLLLVRFYDNKSLMYILCMLLNFEPLNCYELIRNFNFLHLSFFWYTVLTWWKLWLEILNYLLCK